jgi:hypothetical protein
VENKKVYSVSREQKIVQGADQRDDHAGLRTIRQIRLERIGQIRVEQNRVD